VPSLDIESNMHGKPQLRQRIDSVVLDETVESKSELVEEVAGRS